MREVEAYLRTLGGTDRDALGRVIAIARDVVPEAEEGTSYARPALLYGDEGLVATVRTKKFLSLYPYSDAVTASVLDARRAEIDAEAR